MLFTAWDGEMGREEEMFVRSGRIRGFWCGVLEGVECEVLTL